MRANKLPVPTEAQEQMTLFSWAAMQSGKYPELNLLYHVPNGGSRHKAEAGRLRAEGVKAGVPDLCLPVGVAGRSFGAGLQSRALLRLGTGGGNNYRISNRRWHT